jgi:hypothetical protein
MTIMFNLTTHEQRDQLVAILSFRGDLNSFTYLDLINKARELYESGHRNLVLDMRGIQTVGLAGFFALYSAAMLFNGDAPLDPVGGFNALYTMAEKVVGKSTHHFKLLQPQPNVKNALSKSGLPIYEDLDSVLTSF